jgi:transcriptional regulator with XRE-family HTH domain
LVPFEPIYLDFGRRLRKARRKATLTQETLAQRVGLSRTSVTNIELGHQPVTLHLLYELAKAVGVRPEQLLPDEAAADTDGSHLADVLMGLRRADRSRVERDIEQLTQEDQELVLRLVRKEESRK